MHEYSRSVSREFTASECVLMPFFARELALPQCVVHTTRERATLDSVCRIWFGCGKWLITEKLSLSRRKITLL